MNQEDLIKTEVIVTEPEKITVDSKFFAKIEAWKAKQERKRLREEKNKGRDA